MMTRCKGHRIVRSLLAACRFGSTDGPRACQSIGEGREGRSAKSDGCCGLSGDFRR